MFKQENKRLVLVISLVLIILLTLLMVYFVQNSVSSSDIEPLSESENNEIVYFEGEILTDSESNVNKSIDEGSSTLQKQTTSSEESEKNMEEVEDKLVNNSSDQSSEYVSNILDVSIGPNISITYPIDNAAYIQNIVLVNYTVDSADSCWYSVDNGATNSSTVTAGTAFTGLNLGTSDLIVYCNNSLGYIGSDNASFIVGYFDTVTQVNKLQSSDIAEGDALGYSVSISGDYAIIGAKGEDSGTDDEGAAYIFKKNSTTGLFEEVNKIVASDKDVNAYFGSFVSISGDYAIVGAPFEDSGTDDEGAAYIFKKNSTTGLFEEVNKIVASDMQVDDNFGFSVSISGDYAIVGAHKEDTGGVSAGAAYIFKKNSTTGLFEEVNKIQASNRGDGDLFGISASISGDYAIVGSRDEDTGASNVGAAYIFKKNPTTGLFEEVHMIQASDKGEGDFFGYSSSISGDYAIVGAFNNDAGTDDEGAAYIFKKNSTTGLFEEVNKIVASDKEVNDNFGQSTSINGDYAIVGAPKEDSGTTDGGSAYVFKKNSTTGLFEEVSKIQSSDRETYDYFGIFGSVSISRDNIIVGAKGEDTGGNAAGAAYSFNMTETFIAPTQTENNISDGEGSGEGTNLSSYNSNTISSVSNYIWHRKGKGKIKWITALNLANANIGNDNNLDNDIEVGDRFVSVDSSTATAFASKSANVTFENVDCSLCNSENILYSSNYYTSLSEIQGDGQSCSLVNKCSSISCTTPGGTGNCTFIASSFSGYAIGGNVNLTINDSVEGSSALTDTEVSFYAKYLNVTDNSPIASATCTVMFDDNPTSYSMTWNGTGTNLYNFTKSAGFASAAMHDWNVTCSKTGFTTLLANDTIEIQSVASSSGGTSNQTGQVNFTQAGSAGIILQDDGIAFGSGYFNTTCSQSYSVLDSSSLFNAGENGAYAAPGCWINTTDLDIEDEGVSPVQDYHWIENNGTTVVSISASSNKDGPDFICARLDGGVCATAAANLSVKAAANETTACSQGLNTTYQLMGADGINNTIPLCAMLHFADTKDDMKVYYKLTIPSDISPGFRTMTITYIATTV